jgi:hypothetical protein
MAKYQNFLSRIGSNRDRAALRGIFSMFLTDNDPPQLKDLTLASIVLSGAETTQITVSGASTTGILLSGTSTTTISITGACTTAIDISSVCTTGLKLRNAVTGIDMTGMIKQHDHASTGDYAYQLRTESNKATGDFYGMDCEVHSMINRTANSVRGLSMTARVTASTTISGSATSIHAGYFLLDVDGTLNGGGIFAPLIAKVDAGGAYTAVGHLASLWIDSTQEGSVTGEHELLYASNNGASQMDSFLYLYAGDKITNFFKIDTATGMVGNAVTADYTFTKTRKVKVVVGGETGYLIVDIV